MYLSIKITREKLPFGVLVPFYRGAVVFKMKKITDEYTEAVLVPFYRGAVVFKQLKNTLIMQFIIVLVPFYRGAVVFQFEIRI